MREWMICPIRGQKFDAAEVEYLDNGNLACYRFVKEERKENENTDE